MSAFFTLTMTVMDPYPGPGPLVTEWTQLSGPSTAIIQQPSELSSGAIGNTPGTYVFQASADSGNGPGFDTTTVEIT